ncbi:hypothetical protein [Streptomyces showdoensis]|uniref:hypothetical protein n=1 Tax=Streptomyces showdoensis TaxID=68268 RepID=UPI0013F4D001|nr:hypothetical protein [Streptomyces showdoensis]
MLTYETLGFHGLFALVSLTAAARLFPAGTQPRRYLARAALVVFILIAAITALSY